MGSQKVGQDWATFTFTLSCMGLSASLGLDWLFPFSMLGKFSTIISSKFFSYPFFFSSSYGTPVIQMLVCLILSQRSWVYPQFFSFFLLFSAFQKLFPSFIFQFTDLFFCFSYSAIESFCRVKKGFPGGSDGKASAYNAGDLGSIPGSGRSPGEGNGNPLQYSCPENIMNGGAW